MKLNAQLVKIMLSREVLSQTDSAVGNVLRSIIFDDDTRINWDSAYYSIMAHMPELKRYEGYNLENMKGETA